MAIRIKPGATLEINCVESAGDITGTTIRSAVKNGDFHYQLTVTETDLSAGEYKIAAASTSTFPVGWLDCDIEYVVSGVTTDSNTFRIYIEPSITRRNPA